jgi:hypothetical protein
LDREGPAGFIDIDPKYVLSSVDIPLRGIQNKEGATTQISESQQKIFNTASVLES